MPSETIHIRFPPDVDGSKALISVAGFIASDFSTAYPDRKSGPRHGCGYMRFGHIWTAWWTKARAVVVRCERRAA